MSVESHVASLETKHANLDSCIAQERHRPYPDQTRITRLKKEKLRLKEISGGLIWIKKGHRPWCPFFVGS